MFFLQWAGNIAQRFFTRYGQPSYAEEELTSFAEVFSKQLAPKLLEQVCASIIYLSGFTKTPSVFMEKKYLPKQLLMFRNDFQDIRSKIFVFTFLWEQN